MRHSQPGRLCGRFYVHASEKTVVLFRSLTAEKSHCRTRVVNQAAEWAWRGEHDASCRCEAPGEIAEQRGRIRKVLNDGERHDGVEEFVMGKGIAKGRSGMKYARDAQGLRVCIDSDLPAADVRRQPAGTAAEIENAAGDMGKRRLPSLPFEKGRQHSLPRLVTHPRPCVASAGGRRARPPV